MESAQTVPVLCGRLSSFTAQCKQKVDSGKRKANDPSSEGDTSMTMYPSGRRLTRVAIPEQLVWPRFYRDTLAPFQRREERCRDLDLLELPGVPDSHNFGLVRLLHAQARQRHLYRLAVRGGYERNARPVQRAGSKDVLVGDGAVRRVDERLRRDVGVPDPGGVPAGGLGQSQHNQAIRVKERRVAS